MDSLGPSHYKVYLSSWYIPISYVYLLLYLLDNIEESTTWKTNIVKYISFYLQRSALVKKSSKCNVEIKYFGIICLYIIRCPDLRTIQPLFGTVMYDHHMDQNPYKKLLIVEFWGNAQHFCKIMGITVTEISEN